MELANRPSQGSQGTSNGGDGIDFEDLEGSYDVEIYHHMEIGQAVNEYRTNLDGCGYIIAKRENVSDAVKAADAALDAIKAFVS